MFRIRRRLIIPVVIVCAAAIGVGTVLAATGGPSPTADAAQAQRVVWSSSFARGNFTDWSWWGQGQENIWGHIAVGTPASFGVPNPRKSGGNIARFEVTPDDLRSGKINAKIYKAFTVPRGADTAPPSDVSGTYKARYYLPSGFKVPYNTWVNIFQFKEKHDGHSDPLWWVQASTASWAKNRRATWLSPKPTRADAPVLSITHFDNNWTRRETYIAAPLDRWFEIRAELVQGQRIVFYIDGKKFDTAEASEYPVSPFRTNSEDWTFGVGEYGTAPAGPLYVAGASYSTPARP